MCVNYFTLGTFSILMETIKDLYISAHRESEEVPSRVVLEFGDAISGISRVSGQAARSIG
jgi:hypothetical protein